MERTKPPRVPLDRESAGLDGTAFAVLLRHQQRAAAPEAGLQKYFCSFILGENQLKE